MATRCLLIILSVGALLFNATAVQAFDPLDPNNTCDYIILTADSLVAQADRLISHRSSEYRTCRVLLSEVQSALPGSGTEEKIRNFLLEAYQNWSIAPTYLLLMGDADHTTPGTGYDLVTAKDVYDQDHLLAQQGFEYPYPLFTSVRTFPNPSGTGFQLELRVASKDRGRVEIYNPWRGGFS